MRGYAVDQVSSVFFAALEESPSFIVDLARESNILDQRILDLLNGKYAKFFRAFTIYARIIATVGLIAYGI